jgi:protein SCO1/2
MPAARAWILGLAVASVACGAEAPLHGVVIDPPQEVPAVRITDADGHVFDLDAERGQHVAAIYFGYTHCPDVCPTTLADWARARRAMGRAASRMRWVFVSVDPQRDTPGVARDYARQFDSSFVGLSPTPAQLDSLKQSWGFAVEQEVDAAAPRAYTVSHPAGTFVVDRTGKLREIFPPATPPDQMAADLRRLP